MKNAKPLDDLEVYEVIKLAYPENFPDLEDGDDWDDVMEFVDSDLGGFDELAELLGRVVMLAPVMKAGLSGKLRHCLGSVSVSNGSVSMISAVSRDCIEK